MELISKIDHLITNIKTVEYYLAEGTLDDQVEISKLIGRGSCLIAYQVTNEYRFVPSRFIGYVNNNLQSHDKSNADGRETNREINKILKSTPLPDENLRLKYLEYCKNLGIKANDKSHSFWQLNLQEYEQIQIGFSEGTITERRHFIRERNPKLIIQAKENFKRKHGKLYCEACRIDYQKTYGQLGSNFYEGHHTLPVKSMMPNHITKPEDIAILCSNCHKIIHSKQDWLTIEQLIQVINTSR